MTMKTMFAEKTTGVGDDRQLAELRARMMAALQQMADARVDEDRLRRILDRGDVLEGGRPRRATDAEVAEARRRMRADAGIVAPSHFYTEERIEAQRKSAETEQAYREALEATQAAIRAARREQAKPVTDAVAKALAKLEAAVEERVRFEDQTIALLERPTPERSQLGGLAHCLGMARRHVDELI